MAASTVTLTSGTPPTTPGTGKVRIYSKADKKLYFKNDAGVEVELTSPQVTSVNGQSGVVVLDAADVGAVDASLINSLTVDGAAGLSVTGGTDSVLSAVSISQEKATASQSGYLDSSDFAAFSNSASNAITSLTDDVSASGPGTASATVNTVGGKPASAIATGITKTENATNLATPSTLVMRDGSGNFMAGTITAALNGNATTATSATSAASATNFTGSLSGEVTGTQSATALSTTGIGAGTYTKLTVDTKGRATAGTTLSSSDIPSLPANKIPLATTSTDGYLSSTDWNTFNTRHIFEQVLSSGFTLMDNQQIVRGSFSTAFDIQLSGSAQIILL